MNISSSVLLSQLLLHSTSLVFLQHTTLSRDDHVRSRALEYDTIFLTLRDARFIKRKIKARTALMRTIIITVIPLDICVDAVSRNYAWESQKWRRWNSEARAANFTRRVQLHCRGDAAPVALRLHFRAFFAPWSSDDEYVCTFVFYTNYISSYNIHEWN